jgi:hypothetical protein
MSFCIMMIPFYNESYQTYQNILSINQIPPGVLAKWVHPIRKSRRQGHSYPYPYQNGCCCQYGILRMSFCGKAYINSEWATPEDLPNLILFLTQNGYRVDTSLTKMMNTSPVRIGNNQQIVCFVSPHGAPCHGAP